MSTFAKPLFCSRSNPNKIERKKSEQYRVMGPETEQALRKKSCFSPWDHGGLVGAGDVGPES